jgi:[acyl-carrier-protein] S-malonyltransferase
MNTSGNNLALVFPGQGSQSVGMLSELAMAYPQVTSTFAEASSVLGYDLWQLVQDGPEEVLNQTAPCWRPVWRCGVSGVTGAAHGRR